MAEDYILEIKGITKRFPGVTALDHISFPIQRGHVHALVGENGAGKSTLIKILAGIYHPEEGSLLLDGKEVFFKTPMESQAAGIRVVHQELKLVSTLTVAENIFLGRLMYKGRLVDWQGMYKKAQELLDSTGVAIKADEVVSNLSVAQQQIVEICKAINGQCKIIVLDEPTATITVREQEILFDIVRKLKSQGVTIIYISHRLEEIFDLADEVTVLRDGQHVKTQPVSEIDRSQLIAQMVGRKLTNEYPKEIVPIGDVALEAKGITTRALLHDISIKVHKGEIVGLAGLVGAGRTEVARAILGIDKMDAGEVYLYGKKVEIHNLREAINDGIGYVPENRRDQGLLPIMSVKNNITIVNLKAAIKNGLISSSLEQKYADEYIEKLSISTPTPETEIQYLSGGNQQKVIIARWMMQNSDIIILDEPTRGVDVGAKAEIYELITEMVKAGKAVIMISSELPEILGMSDRIYIMHDGFLAGEMDREEATQEGIMALCV